MSDILTDAERVDTRRHCGYPVYGPGASGFEGWRYFEAYGALEYRIGNITVAELAVVRTYLNQLATLESAIPGSAENMDTDAAAGGWKRNRDEARDRLGLYDAWRRRLCGFLGVPPGPALGTGAGNVRIIV